MRKILMLLIVIIFCDILYAQTTPFVGVSMHSKGYFFQGGVKIYKWVGLVGYSKPLTSAVNPTLLFSNIGYEIFEKNRVNITPLIGISSFTYLNDETEIKGVTWMSGIEIGKDIHNGRLFINGNYCKVFFFGGGMKIFFN
jgi:hypothetical protein